MNQSEIRNQRTKNALTRRELLGYAFVAAFLLVSLAFRQQNAAGRESRQEGECSS
jgi:hypothetical protein